MHPFSRFLAVFLMLFIACGQALNIAGQQAAGVPSLPRQQDKQFVGRWCFHVGKRTMMVLYLHLGKDRLLTGSLTRPKYFQTQDFSSFNHVTGPVRVEKITSAHSDGNVLSFTVQNPEDRTDTEILELILEDEAHAQMRFKIPGVITSTVAMVRSNNRDTVPSDWDTDRTYSVEDDAPSNPEMKRIFLEDQAVRQDIKAFATNGTAMFKADQVRRDQVMKLLNDGALHSAEDFEQAAFLFQHGSQPDDYLLAHTLAMMSVRKGDANAIWIASATLDRYLNSMKQPQIYGTQFYTPVGQPATQEPYNRTLISDSLRKQLNVPSLAEQNKQRQGYDQMRTPK